MCTQAACDRIVENAIKVDNPPCKGCSFEDDVGDRLI